MRSACGFRRLNPTAARVCARISFCIGARLGRAVRRDCCAAFENVNFAAFVKFVSFCVPFLGRAKSDFYSIFIRLLNRAVFVAQIFVFAAPAGVLNAQRKLCVARFAVFLNACGKKLREVNTAKKSTPQKNTAGGWKGNISARNAQTVAGLKRRAQNCARSRRRTQRLPPRPRRCGEWKDVDSFLRRLARRLFARDSNRDAQS